MARTLTRDEILAADDLPMDYVPTPRWGKDTSVLVKAMPMGHPRFTNYVFGHVGKNPPSGNEINVRRMIAAVIMCAVDEDGAPLFKWSDADQLREKHWNTVTRIAGKAFQLAGDEGDFGTCETCNGTGTVVLDDEAPEDPDQAETPQPAADDASEPSSTSLEVDDDEDPPVVGV